MKSQNNKEVVIIVVIMVIFAAVVFSIVALTGLLKKNNNSSNNSNNYYITNKQTKDKYITCTDRVGSGIIVSNKECIITDDNSNTPVYNTRVPFITLSGKAFDYINKLLLDDFNETNKYATYYKDSTTNLVTLSKVSIMDYKYYDNNDIISLIVKKDPISLSGEERDPQYIIYNIDRNTGEIITSDKLFEKRNINIQNKIIEIKSTIKNIYLKDFGYDVDGIESDPIVTKYYNSFSTLNTRNIYLNQSNNIVIGINLPIPFWSSMESYSIEIGSNYTGYSKQLSF